MQLSSKFVIDWSCIITGVGHINGQRWWIRKKHPVFNCRYGHVGTWLKICRLYCLIELDEIYLMMYNTWFTYLSPTCGSMQLNLRYFSSREPNKDLCWHFILTVCCIANRILIYRTKWDFLVRNEENKGYWPSESTLQRTRTTRWQVTTMNHYPCTHWCAWFGNRKGIRPVKQIAPTLQLSCNTHKE